MKALDLDFIKTRRLELKKSLKEVANSLGMTNASVYTKYESGVYAFKADQLPLLAEVLECEISNFFTYKVAKTEIKTG